MATAVGLSLSIFTSIIAHRAALFGCRFFLNYVKLREFISIPKKVSLFLSVRLIKSQANLLFTYLPVAWVCTNPRPSLGGGGDSNISRMPGCGPNALPKNWI